MTVQALGGGVELRQTLGARLLTQCHPLELGEQGVAVPRRLGGGESTAAAVDAGVGRTLRLGGRQVEERQLGCVRFRHAPTVMRDAPFAKCQTMS